MAIAPSHFASAQSNSVAPTINVGDLVVALLNNADNTAPAGFLDNGGNYYSLATSNADGSVSGASALYVCNKAAFAATTLSFTAGHGPSIAAGTWTGATGIGKITTNNGSSNTSLSASVTTGIVSDYVCALVSFFKTGSAVTVSAGTGTLQSSFAGTSTVNGGAIVSLASATLASYTPAVNVSLGSGFRMYAFEVWPLSSNDYAGTVPPKMDLQLVYKLIPTFGGTTGGPVTPIPVAAVLKGGTTGVAYSETISAQGGSGSGYVYALQSGSLPTSTSLNTATGVISGTPTVAATFSFTIKVTDSLGNFGTQNFSITVAAPSSGGGGVFTFSA